MDEEGRENKEWGRKVKKGGSGDMGGKETFRIRLRREELREREVQEVLKEMNKRIREAMKRKEGEKEGKKKKGDSL